MNKKNLKVNIATFDLIKGITMLVIVIGHMVSYYNVNQLTLFYPLLILLKVVGEGSNIIFFLICGLRFKPKPVKTMLSKSFKELIKPYLYVMLAITLIYPIRHRIEYGGWWYRTFLETMRWTLAFLLGISESGTVVGGFRVQWNSATWFLLALFIAYNVLNLILKHKNEKIQLAFVAICAALGYGLSLLDFPYFCIPQGLLAVVFCYLGYAIQKHHLLDRLISSPGILIFLFSASLYHILWGNFNFSHLEFNNILLDYLGVTCLGLTLLLLGTLGSKIECTVTDWIKNIGVYTYWIICIHSVEMAAFPWNKFNKLAPANYQPVMFIIEILLKAAIIGTFCIILKKITMYKIKRKKKTYDKT